MADLVMDDFINSKLLLNPESSKGHDLGLSEIDGFYSSPPTTQPVATQPTIATTAVATTQGPNFLDARGDVQVDVADVSKARCETTDSAPVARDLPAVHSFSKNDAVSVVPQQESIPKLTEEAFSTMMEAIDEWEAANPATVAQPSAAGANAAPFAQGDHAIMYVTNANDDTAQIAQRSRVVGASRAPRATFIYDFLTDIARKREALIEKHRSDPPQSAPKQPSPPSPLPSILHGQEIPHGRLDPNNKQINYPWNPNLRSLGPTAASFNQPMPPNPHPGRPYLAPSPMRDIAIMPPGVEPPAGTDPVSVRRAEEVAAKIAANRAAMIEAEKAAAKKDAEVAATLEAELAAERDREFKIEQQKALTDEMHKNGDAAGLPIDDPCQESEAASELPTAIDAVETKLSTIEKNESSNSEIDEIMSEAGLSRGPYGGTSKPLHPEMRREEDDGDEEVLVRPVEYGLPTIKREPDKKTEMQRTIADAVARRVQEDNQTSDQQESNQEDEDDVAAAEADSEAPEKALNLTDTQARLGERKRTRESSSPDVLSGPSTVRKKKQKLQARQGSAVSDDNILPTIEDTGVAKTEEAVDFEVAKGNKQPAKPQGRTTRSAAANLVRAEPRMRQSPPALETRKHSTSADDAPRTKIQESNEASEFDAGEVEQIKPSIKKSAKPQIRKTRSSGLDSTSSDSREPSSAVTEISGASDMPVTEPPDTGTIELSTKAKKPARNSMGRRELRGILNGRVKSKLSSPGKTRCQKRMIAEDKPSGTVKRRHTQEG